MKVLKIINYRGAITVFTSIVLASIFLVAGIFTDAARIKLAQAQVHKANQTALSSVLACYNNELKDLYGLFGYNLDYETLNDSYEEYFSKNLNIGSRDFLYGFNIENIRLEQAFSLQNNEIFENQLKEFMKYRAPVKIVSDLLSKIQGISNLSKGSKIYRRKVETERKAGDIGQLQMLLEEKAKSINNSDIALELGELKNKLKEKISVKAGILNELSRLEGEFMNEENSEIRDSLLSSISSIKEELQNIEASASGLRNTMLDTINQYKSYNSEALEYAGNITLQKQELIKRMEAELESVAGGTNGIEEVQKAYRDSMLYIKSLVKEDNSEAITEILERNMNNCLNSINSASESDDSFLMTIDQLCSAAEINYIFNKCVPVSSEEEDNRDRVLQLLEQAFTQKVQLKSIENNVFNQLPSRKEQQQREENIDWSFRDFNWDRGAEKQLQYIADRESSFSGLAENLVNQLYINEYIMGTFRHDVALLKNEDESKAFNLRSVSKYEREGYFSCFEVEYIINGNRDEAVNSMLLKSEILALRLASNVIHIYTDAAKMNRLIGLAAALSSWSAGLAAPILQTVLVFSWAMLESLYDLEQLGLGDKIVLFKNKEQWKTDLSGLVNKNNPSGPEDNPLLLSYQDYLRVFLLLTERDKKLDRIQDLVQMNIALSRPGFTVENTFVALQADTDVTIKNLFLGLPIFASQSGVKLSRSLINASMLLSY
ncbi:hypothetical protein CLHUN_00940 [Ruminiclostridium hungatei]|uniref:Uncharacterized protein n=1 Tax=Ruminiclostridium hungatei TaxID=48256 RepID=A0A1V4SQV9_RUMHU|nr:DUF5702 domain-containing protein [Ruminiclostridium hungatei]OPX46278.1 hypothetical protein CLHUN_00940 [Ruminiclostridium hungatei]